jgi:hypothetical protein
MAARALVPLGEHDVHRAAGIGRVRPFHLLDGALLPWLSGSLRARTFAPGDALAQPGRPVEEAFLLREGLVAVELAGLPVCEVRGPRCLLLDEAHAALPPLLGLRAAGPLSCLALPRGALHALADASGALRALLARRAGRRRALLRGLEEFLLGR